MVNTLYWPHTALSVYLVCYFLVPHTHVLCMGSGSATGKKIQVRLVHSLLKYFFKFQLWYWIKNLHYQIFKFVIDNSDISLNCLQHIQKRRNFDAKVTCHQPICLLLHAILSGVGVHACGCIRNPGFWIQPHVWWLHRVRVYSRPCFLVKTLGIAWRNKAVSLLTKKKRDTSCSISSIHVKKTHTHTHTVTHTHTTAHDPV